MRLNLTTEEFIKKAKEVHGDKYDYTKVNYINNITKVCIICPKHEEFWQAPHNHLSGNGCPKCANEEKFSTTKEFINKAIKVHNGKYTYEKAVYVSNKTPLWITCPIHGDFMQTPNHHLNGSGCPQCGIERHIQKESLTTEEFVNKANKVHNGKYTYENAVYANNKTPLWITCPIHGDFPQTPNSHLQGRGCPICAKEGKISTTNEFINKVTKIHNGKYTYEKAVYVSNKTPLWITCPIHGDFMQTPNHHLKGSGCPKCANEEKTTTMEEFIKKANKVHNGKYTYENAVYANNKTPLWITCPIHGDFPQTPNSHLQGSGCPKCGLSLRNSENRFYDFLKTFLPNVEIVREYRNKQVLGKLHLDFYLPEYRIGLEYQGAQHFKSVKHFGDENGFKKICERDKRKFQKCNEHGIKLFYFTYEVKSVLKDYFAKVYTDEDELKRDMLAYIEEQSLQPQSQMAHSINWMAHFACFEPKDTF